jgi:hypothetical protein
MLEAQIKKSPEILKHQIELLMDVRQAWQQASTPTPVATSVGSPDSATATVNPTQDEQAAASWTA